MKKSIGSTARKFTALVFVLFFAFGAMPAAFAESDDQRDLTNVLTGLDVDMSLKKTNGTTVPIIVDNEKDRSEEHTS